MGGASTTRISPSPFWEEVAGSNVPVPQGAQTVRLSARSFKNQAGGSFDILFDQIVVPEPDPALLGWSAFAALGLLSGARRRTREPGEAP
jgi:hypothetical protein